MIFYGWFLLLRYRLALHLSCSSGNYNNALVADKGKNGFFKVQHTSFANNLSAVGVAAHEAGHAVQYSKGYVPIKVRSVILPVCNLGSQLSMPLLIIGLIFDFYFLVKLGVIFFCAALLFQLLTLPIEFNASHRALVTLDSSGLIREDEKKAVRRVLSAAAMTYVAALLVSLTQLIRLLAISKRNRR